MSTFSGPHARESTPRLALLVETAPADAILPDSPLHEPASSPQCRDQQPVPGAGQTVANPDDSSTLPPKRRPRHVHADLRDKVALTYAEVAAALGIPERSMRRMVSTGRVRRSVLRVGKRAVRFLREVLVEELRKETR